MVERSLEYKQSMELLRTMPKADRAQLLAHLKSLVSAKEARIEQASSVTYSREVRIVVRQLLRFLASIRLRTGIGSDREIDEILGSSDGAAALDRIAAVWAFVALHATEKVEREALFSIGFRCLYDNLNSWMTGGVGINEMLRNLDRFPASLDSQFPGYAASGLLRFIVRNGSVR